MTSYTATPINPQSRAIPRLFPALAQHLNDHPPGERRRRQLHLQLAAQFEREAQFFDRLGPQVVDHQIQAALRDIYCERFALLAESDEANLRHRRTGRALSRDVPSVTGRGMARAPRGAPMQAPPVRADRE